jgi:dipeptidyl aminopeptidase/acylaminoacyl peptidase
MKHLSHIHFMIHYILVLIFLIPKLSFSQNDLDNSIEVNQPNLLDLEPITFDSHGSILHGYFCQAPGEGLHPTIILLHGSPGGNKDVYGIAQAAPKAGWNALVFNYRGFYESEGLSSLKNSVEDVSSAIAFLKSADMVKKYGIDSTQIGIAGYSYGGDIALTAAANNNSIKYVISIAAADISEIARMARQNEAFIDIFVKEIDDRISKGLIKSAGGEEQLRELLEDSENYDIVKHARALSEKSILIIGGWQDHQSTLEGHVLPLIRALQQAGAENVNKVILDTNHSFEGKSTELVNAILEWLADNYPYSQISPVEVDLASNGNHLNSDIYLAPSGGMHPTLIFMHGFPGGIGDPRGLSSDLSALGINILIFNYQGTWGSEGYYSIETSIEDVGAAINFLKQENNIKRFNIDTTNIVVGGWSYGGAIAMLSSIKNPEVKRVISLAGADESVFGRKLQTDPDFYKMMYQMFKSVIYPQGSIAINSDLDKLFINWINNIDKYDLIKHAKTIKDRDIFLIGGWKDQQVTLEDHILPLYREFQKLGAEDVSIKVFDTDHYFANVKDELVKTLSDWIKLKPD